MVFLRYVFKRRSALNDLSDVELVVGIIRMSFIITHRQQKSVSTAQGREIILYVKDSYLLYVTFINSSKFNTKNRVIELLKLLDLCHLDEIGK